MTCSYLHHYMYSLIFYLTIVNGNNDWTFPPELLVGTATSSYQVEGAWNVSDKGENIWDSYTHAHPNRFPNKDNGDIACDSYHKYKEDVQLVKQMGMDYYRFSLSWSRILPTGYPNKISKDGIKYYNNLLDELEKNNIEPLVTIYHWDHPQVFQDIGGWTNEVLVDLFGDYARLIFQEFGHRIKTFITINEPNSICRNGYYTGYHAPGLRIGKHAEYLCTHNVIKAHARAYHIYNKEFRTQQGGKVGIVLDCTQYYSKYKNDTLSAEVAFQYQCGRYASPIFSKTGDYPSIIKKRIAENSKYEGLKKSRLPVFSKKWKSYIRGSADFIGLNHYSSSLAEPAPRPKNTIYANDDGLIYSSDPKWPSTSTGMRIVPDGFRDLLRRIKIEYGNVQIYVTENGLADIDTLDDNQRMEYLYLYIKALLTAIKEYNCNVKAYTVWSLLDNFEWERGYTVKFGLFRVDFKDPNRTRTPKKSVAWLTSVLHHRKLEPIN